MSLPPDLDPRIARTGGIVVLVVIAICCAAIASARQPELTVLTCAVAIGAVGVWSRVRSLRRSVSSDAGEVRSWSPAEALTLGLSGACVALLPLVERLSATSLLPIQTGPISVTAVAVLGCVAAFPALEQWTGSRWITLVISSYVGVIAVAAARNHFSSFAWSASYGVLQIATWISLFILGAVFGAIGDNRRHRFAAACVALGPGVVVVANGVLYFIGVRAPSGGGYTGSGQAELLAIAGVNVERITFPLMSSANGGGLVAGLALCMSLTFMVAVRGGRPTERVLFALVAVFSVFVLVMADARASLLFAFLVPGVLAVTRPSRYRASAWVVLTVPLSAGVLLALLTLVNAAGQALGLVRGNTASVLSDRDLIWGPVLERLAVPGPDTLFGHGAFGQTVSGVVYRYNGPFYGIDARPELLPPHNFGLQVALDTGLIGLVAITVGLFALVRHLGSIATRARYILPLIAGLLFTVVVGWTEATPSEANPYMLIWWLVALGFACAQRGVFVDPRGAPDVHGRQGCPGADSSMLEK